MRVNVYAEEMTNRIEIIEKEGFTGVRFYLELPASYHISSQTFPQFKPATIHDKEQAEQLQAPFIHRPGDDDSSAVTFWGKRDLRVVLRDALTVLDEYYSKRGHSEPEKKSPANHAPLGGNKSEFYKY